MFAARREPIAIPDEADQRVILNGVGWRDYEIYPLRSEPDERGVEGDESYAVGGDASLATEPNHTRAVRSLVESLRSG